MATVWCWSNFFRPRPGTSWDCRSRDLGPVSNCMPVYIPAYADTKFQFFGNKSKYVQTTCPGHIKRAAGNCRTISNCRCNAQTTMPHKFRWSHLTRVAGTNTCKCILVHIVLWPFLSLTRSTWVSSLPMLIWLRLSENTEYVSHTAGVIAAKSWQITANTTVT